MTDEPLVLSEASIMAGGLLVLFSIDIMVAVVEHHTTLYELEDRLLFFISCKRVFPCDPVEELGHSINKHCQLCVIILLEELA